LDREEVLGEKATGEGGLIFEICCYLYPRYNTVMLGARERSTFPDSKTKPIVGGSLSCLGGRKPEVVIAAKPFQNWHVWTVLTIDGFVE